MATTKPDHAFYLPLLTCPPLLYICFFFFIFPKSYNLPVKMALWATSEGTVAKYIHENAQHITYAEVGTAAALRKLSVSICGISLKNYKICVPIHLHCLAYIITVKMLGKILLILCMH